jgi:hypothetical protein
MRFYTDTNPDFFRGTSVETTVADELQHGEPGDRGQAE